MIYLHPASPLQESRKKKDKKQRPPLQWHASYGILVNPRLTVARSKVIGKWAMDNDAFAAWDAYRFIKALETYRGLPNCLFVVAPDVVGDHTRTLKRFHIWKGVIQEYGYPLAFVAQNGLANVADVPFNEISTLFIGGDNTFKLGAFVASLVKAAKARGCACHMGRVNTLTRLRYAAAIGCDSVDGTKIRFDQQFINKFPAYLDIANKQELLWG